LKFPFENFRENFRCNSSGFFHDEGRAGKVSILLKSFLTGAKELLNHRRLGWNVEQSSQAMKENPRSNPGLNRRDFPRGAAGATLAAAVFSNIIPSSAPGAEGAVAPGNHMARAMRAPWRL
jgi:hypothetical protein